MKRRVTQAHSFGYVIAALAMRKAGEEVLLEECTVRVNGITRGDGTPAARAIIYGQKKVTVFFPDSDDLGKQQVIIHGGEVYNWQIEDGHIVLLEYGEVLEQLHPNLVI